MRSFSVLALLALVWAGVNDLTFLSGHPVTISGATPEQRRIVVDSLDLFVTAGLAIPRTHVHVLPSDSRMCRRRPVNGYALETRLGNYVWLCTVQTRTVVHEMAHIWTYSHLDGSARAAWTERREAVAWRGTGVPWRESGAEHAADILTWYVYSYDQGRHSDRISGSTLPTDYLADVAWLVAASSDPSLGAEQRILAMGGQLASAEEVELLIEAADSEGENGIMPAIETDPVGPPHCPLAGGCDASPKERLPAP